MRRSRKDRQRARHGVAAVTSQPARRAARAARPEVPTGREALEPRGAAYHDARFEMTVGAFLARQRSGALHEGPRAELVAGKVVAGAALDPGEAAALVNLAAAFTQARLADLGVDVLTWAPLRLGPIDLVRAALALLPGPTFFDEHEVEPPWTRRPRRASAGIGGSFDPASALLVVEPAAAGRDQHARLAGYAAAGASEVWLLDVRRGWVESYRSPWRSEYRSRTLWYPGESVPVATLAGVAVEALVPP